MFWAKTKEVMIEPRCTLPFLDVVGQIEGKS